MHSFSSHLILWQRQNGRHDLPWQGADAYRVWLSEIMLQQTQVATVIPYYQRFTTAFPTIAALAEATEEQVLAHWSGLGYYARGRNLHRAARLVAEKYRGEFPHRFEQMLELPGIGRSTAAAISALAYHERRAILDGNVKRVLSRYCGIEGWAGAKQVESLLWQHAEALLPPHDVAIYIQAQMDMGATLCTRNKPKCGECPVQAGCVACQTNRVHELPTPRPRKAVPEKHSTFLLLIHGNDILLEKRAPQGIWGGLWCLPQFEDSEEALAWCVQQGVAVEKRGRLNSLGQYKTLPRFTHALTHFKLHITPILLRVPHKLQRVQQPGNVWLDVEKALNSAIPTPVRSLLQKLNQMD